MPLTSHRSELFSDAAFGKSLFSIMSGFHRKLIGIVLLACVGLSSGTEFAIGDDYKTYDDAMAAGAKALKAQNYLAAEEPLEAAVDLAKDDFTRIKVYRMLFPSYRLQPEITKMLNACEFILDHSQSSPEKSIIRRELLNFVKQRGKTDSLIEHFDKRLSQDENDRTALFVLSEAYDVLKKDPEKGAAYTERFTKVVEADGEEVDVLTYAKLAAQYVSSKKYQQGAELYEKIAPKEETMTAWHWKEAAAAWLKADEKEKALAAAQNSTKHGPESRSQLLTYYWNDQLGDVYLDLENPALAIPHYEAALKSTNIAGYIKSTEESLEKARELAK